MATKEEITARLTALDAERKTLKAESKDAASATTIALDKLNAYSRKSPRMNALFNGVAASMAVTLLDDGWTFTAKSGGAGGTKSPSRSRAANVETWFANGKDIGSAMPSKMIKAIGEDYGADSPERWLDKNIVIAELAKVAAVIDGKKIPVAVFVKDHPAI